MMIKDYAGGTVATYGPFTEIRFRCVTQSFPAFGEPTVTYSVVTESGGWQELTVSIVHTIETA